MNPVSIAKYERRLRIRRRLTTAFGMSSNGAKRVEYKSISDRQLIRIHDNLIGVIDNWILDLA